MRRKGGMWSDAEKGGREGWFGDHPFTEEEVDVISFPYCITIRTLRGYRLQVHFRRLKASGFTTIRYLVTWVALEHAGP